MNYPLKLDQNNLHRERLEMAIINILPFIQAEAVYVSCNRTGKVIVISFILKEELDEDREYLNKIMDKLTDVYPDFIFKFISSRQASYGFRKGKPYFIQHCTLKELVYFEAGAKVFYPRKNISKELIKKAKKRFYMDMEAAVVSLRNVSVYIRNNKNLDAAFVLHQTLRYIYICASEFFTPEFISSTCLLEQYDYTIDFAPSLKKILNKDVKTDKDILTMLNAAFCSVEQNKEMTAIDPTLIVTAKTKIELLQREINRLFLEYRVLCKEKIQELSDLEILGKHIFSAKLPSNYFIDDALKSIGTIIGASFKIRCLYCFGYTVIYDQEKTNKKKSYSKKIPRYHFYLLAVNLDPVEDEVPLMEDLIHDRFKGAYKVTILSHCSEYIRKRKQNQKYFFDYIMANGLLVYNNPFYLVCPKSYIAKWEQSSKEKYEEDKVSKALYFFSVAQDCFDEDIAIIKKELLRKVMEQTAAGLIYLYLGYDTEKLPVKTLFSLLEYIHDVELPLNLNNEKEVQLFLYLFETKTISIKKEKHNTEYNKLIQYRCILFLKQAKDLAEKAAAKLDHNKTRFFN